MASAIDVHTPVISKEIQEIVHHHPQPEIHVEIGKPEHRVVVYSDRVSSGESKGTMISGGDTTSFGSGNVGPEVSHLGWGRWYTLRELEAATNGLSPENVIGEGGYGIVYSGVLGEGTRVAVKNLLNNRYPFWFSFSCLVTGKIALFIYFFFFCVLGLYYLYVSFNCWKRNEIFIGFTFTRETVQLLGVKLRRNLRWRLKQLGVCDTKILLGCLDTALRVHIGTFKL